jgi:hypothetical protein
MNQLLVRCFAEKINPWTLHFGQFHVQPSTDSDPSELPHGERGRSLQQQFQGNIVFLYEFPPWWKTSASDQA